MLNTPVAFLIFNRPRLTELVFQKIAEAQPKKLLVVADGPRNSEEADKCKLARAVIKKIDWECEILTNFSEQNLGCKYRVSSGLDWVFSQVEEAIILEDDCVPTSSFFYFCQALLEHYRHDERIMMISGDNFQSSDRTEYSYYFSKYSHVWGWASWRRAWQYYDVNMKTWLKFKKLGLIRSVCEDHYEQKYWVDMFDYVFDGAIDSWGYQWLYTCWHQNGLSIYPNSNLVSNVGFGVDATHTSNDTPLARLATTDIWEIRHPSFIIRDRDADEYTFDYHYRGKNVRSNLALLFRAKRYAKLLRSFLQKSR